MTVQEAILILETFLKTWGYKLQMKALEVIKEKQIPKKPIVKPTTKEKPITHNLGRLLCVHCPVCGKRIFAIYESDLERGCGLVEDVKGCSRCLQAIDFTGYYSKR